MLYRRVLFALVAVLAMTAAAEEAAADPCLAEDYAHENCARIAPDHLCDLFCLMLSFHEYVKVPHAITSVLFARRWHVLRTGRL